MARKEMVGNDVGVEAGADHGRRLKAQIFPPPVLVGEEVSLLLKHVEGALGMVEGGLLLAAKIVAKTELSCFHSWSLPYFLP